MPNTPRKVIDCRDFPNDKNCTLTISGTEQEVIEAAIYHIVAVHKHRDITVLREQVRSMLKDEPAPRSEAAKA